MNDGFFMRRCLDLADQGRGKVGNAPMVGSVIVRNGTILGEGFYNGAHSDHAERAALKSVQKISTSFETPARHGEVRATASLEPRVRAPQDDVVLYISLEPCVPHPSKKTPGCAPAIIASGIKRVVIGMQDPDERVAGKGIAMLRDAGITVAVSDMRAECEWQSRGYISVRTKNRPWITLKSARMHSGAIAKPDGSPLKITSPAQDTWSHTFLRATHDAILVGVGTVIADDPSLNTRFDQKKRQYQAWRIVLDPNNRMPKTAKLLTDEHSDKTIVIRTTSWEELWKQLLDRGITSVLVEGGQKTWDAFRSAGFVDADVSLIGAS